MKLQYFLLVSLFIITYCINSEIIRIPENATDYIIKTKKGVLRYSVEKRDKILDIKYVSIEGIQDPDSIGPYELEGVSVYTTSRTVVFEIYNPDFKKINNLLCDLFYSQKYISQKIYSVGKGENNVTYRYFGGTPTNILEGLNKFIFKLNEEPALKLIRDGEVIYYNPWWDSYEFNEEMEKNCASNTAIDEWRDLFFDLDVIYFKIGENIIMINPKNENDNVRGKKDSEYNFYTYPCKKWVFGMNILRLADVRTFNLEDNEVTLYLSKKQNVIINEKDGDF